MNRRKTLSPARSTAAVIETQARWPNSSGCKTSKPKSGFSVALIDIDYFKAINDVQGHAAGDAALRDVAETISTHLRGRDYLGRHATATSSSSSRFPRPPATASPSASPSSSIQAVTNSSLSRGSMPLTLSIGLTEAVLDDDAVTPHRPRRQSPLPGKKRRPRNCRRVVVADERSAKNPTAESPKNAALGGMMLPKPESPLLHR